VLEKAAASSTEPIAEMRFFMLLPSTCAKDAGFLAISLEMMPTARPRVSMASIISASLAEKSAFSLSRIDVASLSSPVWVAMSAASSSILESEAEISPVSLSILASSFALVSVAVLMAKPPFLDVSSHHAKYSLNAFSSATPSLVILALRSAINSRTLPRGLESAAFAAGANATRVRKRTAFIVPRGIVGCPMGWEPRSL